ncbi:S-domain-2 5 [Hibiscus trionum]|uniref:non-specific serine/threonine protein kinase n=1 Tax=Hibiscus trionum TaxID=183268 RepID=A0A9W7LVL3_HIBTR|nr:S-domain-2 5 [Hibiscus trionum]
MFEILTLQDCQEACLKNCSCKGAIYYQNLGYCSFLSQVLSFKESDGGASVENFSVIIKVQNSAISQSPNKTYTSPSIIPPRKKQNTIVIVGSILGAIFFVFLICIFIFLRSRKGFQEVEEDYLDNVLGTPTRFSYEDLKNITNNFSNKLGEGGFGSVFHGVLPSASEVAVKNLVGFGPVNKSFIAEVQTIGSIHHCNLVTLVGFCAEKLNRLLVYEYMANGSLDRWIFNKNRETALGWQIRKKIICDIAKGLSYLHQDCIQKILHLDIKPQNILLDENFNAKVSDFGLSKILGKEQSQVVTTMRGTPGYMAPEWLSSVITEKVDVYSFGIVVLEILCGRPNVDGSQQEEDRHLLALFRRKQEEGKLMDLVDKFSNDMQSNAAEVVEMMKVAAWCLQAEYAKRPSMSKVVKLLEGSVDVADKPNESFLNGLPTETMDGFASTVLPSMLSGPR